MVVTCIYKYYISASQLQVLRYATLCYAMLVCGVRIPWSIQKTMGCGVTKGLNLY